MSGRAAWLATSLGLIFANCLISAPRALAATPLAELQNIQFGFEGKYKVGHWTPVAVRAVIRDEQQGEFAARQTHLEVVVPDGEGVPCRFRSMQAPTLVASGESATYEYQLLVKFGRVKSEVHVSLVSDLPTRNVVAERQFFDEVPRAMLSTQELIVCRGALPQLDAANRLQRISPQEKCELAQLNAGDALPHDPLAYDGVDWLIVATSAPQPLPDEHEAAAINAWVLSGGQLLLMSGPRTAELAGQTGVGQFLPGAFGKLVQLTRLPGIVSYSETSEPVESDSGNRRLQIQVPQFVDAKGRIEAYEGKSSRELPLVVRTPRGFGTVVWVGLDLDRAPLDKWPGQKQLLNRLLGRPLQTNANASDEAIPQSGSSIGYVDLSGQLRMSLEQFDRVTFVPFWHVGGLAALYVLLLGPIDYFLLRRLQRPGLTWLTFPLLAIGFCAAGMYYARSAKGDHVQVNQVEVVDVCAGEHLVRSHAWITMFSPVSTNYSLERSARASSGDVPPGLADMPQQGQLSWLGLPGTGLGGMDTAAASPGLYVEPYDVASDRPQVANVPLAIWSTKGFVSRCQGEDRALAEVTLTETPTHQLQGTLVNPLHVELREAMLYFDRWAYPLGTLPADFSDKLEDRFRATSIDAWLTRRKMQGDNDLTPPYDRTDSNAARILQLMMFHDAAGGSRYTRLLNRYDHTLDLSSQLHLGRAMLVGVGPPSAELMLDGRPLPKESQGRQLTIYRYVIAVEPQE